MTSPLTLCMIARDEEALLARCLNSVRELVAEIVLVDTGSRDKTIRIAEEFGARVAQIDFTRVDFAAARNHAISLATQPWIISLDADELLYPGSDPIVKELVGRNEDAGYYFERFNFQADGTEPTLDHAVRLFPNKPAYRYSGRVHETVDQSILDSGGRLLRTPIRVAHEFSTDVEARKRRNLLYIGILQEELAATPQDQSRLVFLAAEYHQLGMFDKAAQTAAKIASLYPNDPQAQLHTGVYQLVYMNDRSGAVTAFEKALLLRPDYPEAVAMLDAVRNAGAVTTAA